VVAQVTFAVSPLIRGKPLARKILLADDSVTAQNMGRKILADAGYEVITVNNGSAALKKIAESRPDLIVLDVYMPGYSGLEVCQRLKETGDTSRIPVLLTVGKLEPFKPEEARRARADAFIIKPFEASELLSALTKLEDKMVPRSESSKPGRFARAIAAVEEGRYDKSADEDSGWKSRIAFPSKKKEKAPGPEVQDNTQDDAAIYNPVNKDLRTTLDRTNLDRTNIDRTNLDRVSAPSAPASSTSATSAPLAAAQTTAGQTTEERVDLGALAPQGLPIEGLPKDVTPEEIAALAAAAAQIQSTVGEIKGPEIGLAKAEADSKIENKIEGQSESRIETKPESKSENKISEVEVEARKVEARQDESAPSAAGPLAAEKPEQRKDGPELKPELKEEKIEPSPQTANEAVGPVLPIPGVPSPADVTAAIAALETPASATDPTVVDSTKRSEDNPEKKSDTFDSARRSESEPVTMAVAAERTAAPLRWRAVSTALAPEDTGISLEHEMRKAHAAFAAAEVVYSTTSHPTTVPPAATSEVQPTHGGPAATPEVPSPVAAAETVPPQSASLQFTSTESIVTPAISTVPSSPIEAIAAVVKSFETIKPYVEPKISAPGPEGIPVSSAIAPATETRQPIEARQEEARWNESRGDYSGQTQRTEAPASSGLAAAAEEKCAGENDAKEKDTASIVAQSSGPIAAAENGQEPAIAKIAENISERATTESATADHPADKTADKAKRESDIAATTAAAWASWRRIREDGDPKPTDPKSAEPMPVDSTSAAEPKTQERLDEHSQGRSEDPSRSTDQAAMAVAAGAEKTLAETTPEEAPEIANIVDSVLADLRPKIVEEISKKLKKK
jgi:twitching motility two-component system response regulator PilH